MLKDNTDYKDMLNRKKLLKIIFDMRYYEFLSRSKNDENIRIGSAMRVLEDYMELPSRVFRLISDIKSRAILFETIEDPRYDLYNRAGRLYGMYRDSTDHLRELERSILALELACPNIRAFAVELMEFVDSLIEESPIKKSLSHYAEELLKILPYDLSFAEREYLSTKCTNFRWYKAFYFENPSVHRDKVIIDLDALLISLLDTANPPRTRLIERAATAYLKINDDWRVNKDVLKMLLALPREKSQNLPPKLFEIIQTYKKIPLKEKKKILKEIIENSKIKHGTIDIDFLCNLFSQFLKLSSIDECSELFVHTLLSEPDGAELLDYLEVYISYTYELDLRERFLLAYEKARSSNRAHKNAFAIKPVDTTKKGSAES